MRSLEQEIVIENDPFDFTNAINLMGLISNIFAIIYAFGPISLMVKIHKKVLKPTDTPYMIMVTLILMSSFWISYGILKPDNKFFIIFCNTISTPLNLFYMGLFFYYRAERKFLKSLIYTIPMILITGGIFCIFTFAVAIIEVSQYVAMIFNISIYIAPGQNIVKNLFFYSYLIDFLINFLINLFIN